MASQKRMMCTHVAIVATLMISVPSLSSAQDDQSTGREFGAQITAAPPTGVTRPRGGGSEYTPAAGAKDLKSVLFNWAWHMGMLRRDRKSTRLNSSHSQISYAVFCLKKKKIPD